MSRTTQPGQEARTIPSLDGLRAISIALVILSHAVGTKGFPAGIPAFLLDGHLGVQIFFVISGFLITTLLIQEQSRTGTISLRLFFARRTLRIFPPFYFFLMVAGAGVWAGLLNGQTRAFLFAAVYLSNYFPQTWITGHSWSLSVEEQFYIAWPLLMKLCGLRRSLWVAAVISITSPLICLAVYLVNSDVASRISFYFPLVANSIAAGCVLAGILPWLRRQPVFRYFAMPAGDLVAPVIFLLNAGRAHPRIHFAVTETALNLCICYAIVRYIEFPDGVIGRILNNSAVSFVGRLSYSLYIWQQIFMDPYDVGLLRTFPLNVAASLACALASYYCLELTMAGLRKRLRPAAISVI